MKVVRSRVMGFCMGVRRAVKLAQDEAGKGRVFSLGQLVHNPQVLSFLENLGMETKEAKDLPKNLDSCNVIIRAHGIAPEAESDLQKRGASIIDATCSHVKENQLKAQKFSCEGYCIFLAGEANHGEIEGILGYVKHSPFCAVAGSAQEAEKAAEELYKKDKNAKTILLGQTTILENEFLKIENAIKKYFPDLKTEPAICSAVTERQNALLELLEKTEAVIIAGGKSSSNTRRLAMTAKESGKPFALVQSADEIPSEFFSFNTVGLCSGSSAPDSLIDEIEKRLLS